MNPSKAALQLPGAQPPHAQRRAQTPLAAKATGASIQVSLHDDVSEIEIDWRRFEQHADCTVFQSLAWLTTWQSHIGQQQGTRCVVAVGRDKQGWLFVLPLAIERRGGVRVLTWWGSENNDYNAPLLAPDLPQRLFAPELLAQWRQIMQRLQAQPRWRFDLVEFVRMPARVGSQPNPFVSLPVSPHPDRAYLTHLAGNWDSFYASKRSPATRRRERTKRNRLGAWGAIDFVSPTNADDRAQSLDQLIAQKSLSFARMGARNIFERPGWAAFYRALASDAGARELAHLSRLNVGAEPAAINLGLVFKGTYYHLLASHVEGDMARFSPGGAHLQALLGYAMERGCTVYDFTIGDESYKRDWSDTQAQLFDHVSAVRLRGMALAPVLRVQTSLKRFIKQTPAVWNAFMRWRARWAGWRAAPLPTSSKEPS